MRQRAERAEAENARLQEQVKEAERKLKYLCTYLYLTGLNDGKFWEAIRWAVDKGLREAEALAKVRGEALEELEKRLRWLSAYEKKPPEVVKDDFAYDRLLEFVKGEASKWADDARAAAAMTHEEALVEETGERE